MFNHDFVVLEHSIRAPPAPGGFFVSLFEIFEQTKLMPILLDRRTKEKKVERAKIGFHQNRKRRGSTTRT